MGTRSYIGITDGNTVKAIYCNFDGYISYNGVILALAYTDENKIYQLIKSGGKISLGYNIEYPRNVLNREDLDSLHIYSNAHFLTSFCTSIGESFEEFNIEDYHSGVQRYVYLYDTVSKQWLLLEKDKKGDEQKYSLLRLCTEKEYFYNYVRETGDDMDKWIDIRKRYSRWQKEMNGEVSLVVAYNEELRKVIGEDAPFKFGRFGDYYVLYKKGAKEPVWIGFIMADAIMMLKNKMDLKKRNIK